MTMEELLIKLQQRRTLVASWRDGVDYGLSDLKVKEPAVQEREIDARLSEIDGWIRIVEGGLSQ